MIWAVLKHEHAKRAGHICNDLVDKIVEREEDAGAILPSLVAGVLDGVGRNERNKN